MEKVMLLPRRKKKKRKRQAQAQKIKRKKKRQCCKKKKKEGNVTYCPGEREKKKKRQLEEPMCTCTWAFLSIKKKFIPTQFFPHFGRKHFGWLEEETLGPHHLFFFLPTQSNTLQKSFYSHFLSKIFHLPCFISKQTHP